MGLLSALFSRGAPLPEAPASRMPPPEQALIFATIGALLAGLFLLQRRAPGAPAGQWLPRDEATGKRAYEAWVLAYSVVWMGSFGLIIALQLYEAFDATAYFVVCGGLALPLWVQARASTASAASAASAPSAASAASASLHPLHSPHSLHLPHSPHSLHPLHPRHPLNPLHLPHPLRLRTSAPAAPAAPLRASTPAHQHISTPASAPLRLQAHQHIS